MDTTRATAQAVETARTEAGISRKALSTEAGIPYATLYRQLEGQSPFRVTDIEAIARVLNVDPNGLVKFEAVA